MEPQRCKRRRFFSHTKPQSHEEGFRVSIENPRETVFSLRRRSLFTLFYPFVSWCLGVRFDRSTSTATASKLVSVSGVPAREDAAPSNLQDRSKLGTSTSAHKYRKQKTTNHANQEPRINTNAHKSIPIRIRVLSADYFAFHLRKSA